MKKILLPFLLIVSIGYQPNLKADFTTDLLNIALVGALPLGLCTKKIINNYRNAKKLKTEIKELEKRFIDGENVAEQELIVDRLKDLKKSRLSCLMWMLFWGGVDIAVIATMCKFGTKAWKKKKELDETRRILEEREKRKKNLIDEQEGIKKEIDRIVEKNAGIDELQKMIPQIKEQFLKKNIENLEKENEKLDNFKSNLDRLTKDYEIKLKMLEEEYQRCEETDGAYFPNGERGRLTIRKDLERDFALTTKKLIKRFDPDDKTLKLYLDGQPLIKKLQTGEENNNDKSTFTLYEERKAALIGDVNGNFDDFINNKREFEETLNSLIKETRNTNKSQLKQNFNTVITGFELGKVKVDKRVESLNRETNKIIEESNGYNNRSEIVTSDNYKNLGYNHLPHRDDAYYDTVTLRYIDRYKIDTHDIRNHTHLRIENNDNDPKLKEIAKENLGDNLFDPKNAVLSDCIIFCEEESKYPPAIPPNNNNDEEPLKLDPLNIPCQEPESPPISDRLKKMYSFDRNLFDKTGNCECQNDYERLLELCLSTKIAKNKKLPSNHLQEFHEGGKILARIPEKNMSDKEWAKLVQQWIESF